MTEEGISKNCIIIGQGAAASGIGAIAFGYGAGAHGDGAMAIGHRAYAEGKGAMAIGDGTRAIGVGAQQVPAEFSQERIERLKALVQQVFCRDGIIMRMRAEELAGSDG